jgi:hypothetical protein
MFNKQFVVIGVAVASAGWNIPGACAQKVQMYVHHVALDAQAVWLLTYGTGVRQGEWPNPGMLHVVRAEGALWFVSRDSVLRWIDL